MLPDKTVHIGKVFVARGSRAGEPRPPRRQIRRLFDPPRRLMRCRARLRRRFRNRVGFGRVGFGWGERWGHYRRGLLWLLRRLCLSRRGFGRSWSIGRFRRVAFWPIDLLRLRITEILGCKASARRRRNGFRLRLRRGGLTRCRRRGGSTTSCTVTGSVSPAAASASPSAAARQQVQQEGADRPAQRATRRSSRSSVLRRRAG
jgi:hypothetical protein